MTLEDAKNYFQKMIGISVAEHETGGGAFYNGQKQAYYDAQSILAKVETPDPDEEGRAVLWLIVEHGWAIQKCEVTRRWKHQDQFDDFNWIEFSPVTEAKKLGWGG